MKLEELVITGYKCFKEETRIPFHNLTVLIGENDSGKSTIIKAIDLLLGKYNADSTDFYSSETDHLDSFTISAVFSVNRNDVAEELHPYIINNRFLLKKVYLKDEALNTFSRKFVLEDNELENYQSLNAEPMRELLVRYGLPAKNLQSERKLAVKEYIEAEWENLGKRLDEVSIQFSTVSPFLPMFQYFGSHEYGNPQNLVRKTLDNILNNYFYKETGELKSKSIKKVQDRVLERLNASIENNLLDKIQKYNNKVQNIKGRIDLSFSRGLSFNGLEINEGTGFQLIDQKGEGSKKRLFLSILEWDKEVQTTIINGRPLIRAYDEPDSNLHYEAQRKMFYAIESTANNTRSNTQAIIATHSIAMIDRAPSNCINHVLHKEGISNVNYLRTNGDANIQAFLNQISIVGGIKNSSIFYEKCFFIVEGDSEEASIGKIYKRFFNRTLIEDGVILVNLKSNGAWQNFLRLLNSNKKDVTVMLLDTDTQNLNSGAAITPTRLTDIGFDPVFLANNVFFAGTQEFEDLYPDHRIRDILNKIHPKSPTGRWTINNVRDIRANNPKISKGLDAETIKYITHHRNRFNKPEFASEIVDLMKDNEITTIPVLQQVFGKIQQIIS